MSSGPDKGGRGAQGGGFENMTNRLFWLKIGCTFCKIAPELFLGNFNTESAESVEQS